MRQPGDRAPAPGRLALVQDLANTADLEAGLDRLRTVDDLDVFCIDHRLGEVGASQADLEAVRALREALRDACSANGGWDLPESSRRTLGRLFARAPLVAAVRPDGRVTPVPAPALTGVPALTARLAAAVLVGTADGTWRRLKACQAQPCRWVFFDHSPGGQGRWCTMSICGARAKMRAYRARR
jgi:predicted RNA-binding Zn ribbon-like protein